jgi:hypothetical protein
LYAVLIKINMLLGKSASDGRTAAASSTLGWADPSDLKRATSSHTGWRATNTVEIVRRYLNDDLFDNVMVSLLSRKSSRQTVTA